MLDKHNKVITRTKNDTGHCNICGSFGKLTEDHVPPKGSTKITQVLMLSIHQMLDVNKDEAKGRYSQNGVKFKTLCSHCNNHLLGTNYDPSLNYFSSEIIKYVESSLDLPEILHIKSKPNLIARAVIGHMLAIDVERVNETKVFKELVEFFKNTTNKLPEGINIYYWVYPYRKQILIRDAAISKFGTNQFFNFMCIKYFPLAFMVTYCTTEKLNLDSLNPLLNDIGSQEMKIPIRLFDRPRADFPEAPNDDDLSIVAYGKGAMGSIPKDKRRKKS